MLAVALLTGCAGGAGSEVSGGAATSSAPPTASETVASGDGRSSSPNGDRGDGAPTVEEPPDPATIAPHPPGWIPPGSEGPQLDWPPEVTPVHGGRVWAVYLAVGSPDSEWDMHKLGEAESYLQGHGYLGSGIGSVGCDQGAAEALGFDPTNNRVAVYFDSAARAQEFVAVYDRQDVGSAEVTTYCLD
jgi:hypothetical protein